APVSTDTELGRHMTAFETRVRDRRAHAYTRHLMETKARLSREAWRGSMDASDLAHGEVMSLRTTVLGQMSEIRELHSADHRRQAVTSEMLRADHMRSAEMRELRTTDYTRQQQLIQTLIVMQSLQGQVTALQGQVTPLQGQQGPAGGPAQPELPEEAAAYTDIDSDAVITGTGDHTTGTGYRTAGTELALLCVRMFPEESDKIERYVGGLPDMIHGNIIASKPKTMQEAVEMATKLMDKKVITISERQAENKRKFENTSLNNQKQQQQNKRQNTGRAYTTGTGEKKPYGGSKPLCAKCNYHHDGPCAPK
ncbi:hypothetical protein Tco_0047166, partial [Tanacetum coccineum]